VNNFKLFKKTYRGFSWLAVLTVVSFLSLPLAHAAKQAVSETDLAPAKSQIQNIPATTLGDDSPAKQAKEDFSGGVKGVGGGFKHGTQATGNAFKKAGTTMGSAFAKAGHGIKWFFTGGWINKKSDVQEKNVAATEPVQAAPAEPAAKSDLDPMPASDLDSVGNDVTPKKKNASSKPLVKKDVKKTSEVN
jgi:hypothetical protein